MTAIPNKYAGSCRVCGEHVAAGAGVCEKQDGAWRLTCAVPCQPNPNATKKEPARTAAVGDLGGILALFDRAKKHLKYPAIVLSVTDQLSIRINVAGERAHVPGSLTVVDASRDDDGQRAWLGRILVDGVFQPSKQGASIPALVERLRQFAADPARVAGEDGRLHGRCCFCRIALFDERSTAVGYGRICADHFGLSWGAKPEEFAAPAAGARQVAFAEAAS